MKIFAETPEGLANPQNIASDSVEDRRNVLFVGSTAPERFGRDLLDHHPVGVADRHAVGVRSITVDALEEDTPAGRAQCEQVLVIDLPLYDAAFGGYAQG